MSGFVAIPTDVPVVAGSSTRSGRIIKNRYVTRSVAEREVKNARAVENARVVFVDDRTAVGHFHPWAVEVDAVATKRAMDDPRERERNRGYQDAMNGVKPRGASSDYMAGYRSYT